MNSSNLALHEKHESAVTGEILGKLACPTCRGDLAEQLSGNLSCLKCQAAFPVKDGVAFLAIQGAAETWGVRELTDSTSYQAEYVDPAAAAAYNAGYRRKFTKRLSTKLEFQLIDQLLGSRPRCSSLLDLPCGGGRLSSRLAPHTDLLIESDIGAGQVLHSKQNALDTTKQFWMTASAFHIPLKRGAVDAVFCARLCHHLPTAAERERLMQELLRVADRYVVMTFFDHHSLKNVLRRVRAPFTKKPPKLTMTIKQVATIAERNGAKLVAWPRLSFFGSGHRYALMVKQ